MVQVFSTTRPVWLTLLRSQFYSPQAFCRVSIGRPANKCKLRVSSPLRRTQHGGLASLQRHHGLSLLAPGRACWAAQEAQPVQAHVLHVVCGVGLSTAPREWCSGGAETTCTLRIAFGPNTWWKRMMWLGVMGQTHGKHQGHQGECSYHAKHTHAHPSNLVSLSEETGFKPPRQRGRNDESG